MKIFHLIKFLRATISDVNNGDTHHLNTEVHTQINYQSFKTNKNVIGINVLL